MWNYSLAFTCQGTRDDPETGMDEIEFRAFAEVDELIDGEDRLDVNFE